MYKREGPCLTSLIPCITYPTLHTYVVHKMSFLVSCCMVFILDIQKSLTGASGLLCNEENPQVTNHSELNKSK